MPAVTGRVALSEDERVGFDLVDDGVDFELVFHEDVGDSGWVGTWTVAVDGVAVGVRHVGGGVVLVEVLAVPTVWEVDGPVEAWVGIAVGDACWEAAAGSDAPGPRRSVADPLGDVLVLLV